MVSIIVSATELIHIKIELQAIETLLDELLQHQAQLCAKLADIRN